MSSDQLNRAHLVMDGCDRLNLDTANLGAIVGAYFTGQTGDRQAIATVRRQIDFDDSVVEAKVLAYALTDRGIKRQLIEAVVVF